MESTITVPSAPDYQEALAFFGVKEELFMEIGGKILAAYSQTTPHDAANASGSFAYFEAVRSVRDLLCPKGWKPTRKNNLELTALPERKISILVSSGDKFTGNKKVEPSTKNPKGNQTRKIVYSNITCPYLFPQMNNPAPKEFDEGPTWILLYHVDVKNSEMRMELSLPTGFDANELRVHGWNKRIILPSIDFDSSSIVELEPEYTPEVEIEIIRKSNG